ncbi:thiosulfate oxidation carrier protein SoxY [Candidatus Halobeggiatoa sp. HSG11]|nr:thiosulfate oxidation carrier protein SoxY [Candidatus Halobeggiatoa sp. HSG11]
MNTPRREFLKNVLATGGALVFGTTVLPSMAAWPDVAFQAKTTDEALMALFEGKDTQDSDKITLDIPDTAENGAVVPVEISTSLEQVESITIIVENNPIPLVSQFNLTEHAVPWLKTRIKMAKKSDVIAVVKTQDGGLYSTRKSVTVAKGGCAG